MSLILYPPFHQLSQFPVLFIMVEAPAYASHPELTVSSTYKSSYIYSSELFIRGSVGQSPGHRHWNPLDYGFDVFYEVCPEHQSVWKGRKYNTLRVF